MPVLPGPRDLDALGPGSNTGALVSECATARTRARPVKTFKRSANGRSEAKQAGIAADRRYLAAAICAMRIKVAA